MKAYIAAILIIDHNEVGDNIKDIIENTRYPNCCINPHVIELVKAEIGEWNDNHPLNDFMDKRIIKEKYNWIPIF